MEKYAVPQTDSFAKTASSRATCPSCGSPLRDSSPPSCVNCGTKPVEEQFLLSLRSATPAGQLPLGLPKS